jgi:hypothetical protein
MSARKWRVAIYGRHNTQRCSKSNFILPLTQDRAPFSIPGRSPCR